MINTFLLIFTKFRYSLVRVVNLAEIGLWNQWLRKNLTLYATIDNN